VKEANWNDCLFNKLAKSAKPDLNRAKSLIETSKERVSLIREINEKMVISCLKTIILL